MELARPWTAVATEYRSALIALAGRGIAWQPSLTSRTGLWWLGMAREFVRLHSWLVALVDEMDPRTATNTLETWEQSLGLPEPGEVIAATLAERRLDVTAKLLAQAVVTEAEWIALAEAAGYTGVTITQASSTMCNANSTCNAYVQGPYYDAAVMTITMTGSANTAFEALCNRIKPAQSRIIFVYV